MFNHLITSDCLLCDCVVDDPTLSLCDVCLSDLNVYPLGTDLLFSHANISEYVTHDAISGIAVVSNYQWPFDVWIPQLKFHNTVKTAKIMGQLLNQHLTYTLWYSIDLICPMPIHHKRLLERGYNQSELLCRFINYSPNSILYKGLIRNKYTKPQSELNKKQRKNNMDSAFVCLEDLTGKTVLLIDDVITTGYTANTAAQVLLECGATAVYLAAVAIRKFD